MSAEFAMDRCLHCGAQRRQHHAATYCRGYFTPAELTQRPGQRE